MVNFLLATAASGVLSYLLGSINFAIIITKLFSGTDIRDYGSGNAGMTNVLRTVSKKAAALTFLGDFLKGVVSAWISRLIFGALLTEGLGVLSNFDGAYIGTFFSMIGHMFPIFYKFRGGKGISVCAGAILITDWRVLLIIFTVFLVVTLISRYVSLGSICAAVGFTVFTFVLQFFFDKNPLVLYNTLVTLVATVFVVYKHKQNIERLLKGTENKLGVKKDSKEG